MRYETSWYNAMFKTPEKEIPQMDQLSALVEDKPTNSTKELMEFFSAGSRPCGPTEFMAFWKSLTEDGPFGKEYFRTVKLS